MNLVVVDYGVGNLGSIPNMLRRIGVQATISGDAEVVGAADRLILPGVGAFDAGMGRLRALGLEPILRQRVLAERVPVLGLCLGMQLLFERSEEGTAEGLGWLRGVCARFRTDVAPEGLKVPHMGWNTVELMRLDPILGGFDQEPRFYFAHSYHVVASDPEDVVAVSTYGTKFPAVVARGPIRGAQFHPEKSHQFGLQLLRNFVELEP